MKKLLLTIFLFCIVSSAAVAAYNHDTIAAMLIQHSEFEEIQKGVFVSPQTTALRRQELIGLVENAKLRIVEEFGAYTASPIIISSRDPKIRKKYSNNSYAKAMLPPFSESKAYIVIGENRHNADVIAHELMHAEVFHRIGYLNQIVKIPVWFNEGVAMQVDFRDRYNNPSTNQQLEQLKYSWQFFKGSDDQLTQHYSLAKEQVKNLLKNKDKLFLYNFLEGINKGEKFDTLYSDLNERS